MNEKKLLKCLEYIDTEVDAIFSNEHAFVEKFIENDDFWSLLSAHITYDYVEFLYMTHKHGQTYSDRIPLYNYINWIKNLTHDD